MDIKASIFTGSIIRESDFINCNLTHANFTHADLQGSSFRNARLQQADFTGAHNYYIDPTQNNIRKAKFSTPEVLTLLAGFQIEID